jgi:hypothetical protein
MEKAGIVLVISISLIIIGMVLIVLGNDVILEDVIQDNGLVNSERELIITSNLDAEKYQLGVYAIQIPKFEDKLFFFKVVDPSDNQIISKSLQQETTEEEFEIEISGDYKLIVSSNSDDETQIFAAIGPMPDPAKKSLSFISVYLLITGMILLVIAAVLRIKRKKSV